MKKILLLITLSFTITSFAQYAIVSAVDLKEGSEADYLKTEKFWGPCLLYTSPSPRDATLSRMPSSA